MYCPWLHTGWSSPVPIAPAGATEAQFVPGLGVDPSTSGAGQRAAVVYYGLSRTCAREVPCPRIDAWLVTSANGGARWGPPRRLDAQPMRIDWLPLANGRFLGDYLSTSYVAGRPVPVFALAVAPWGGKLREAIMATLPVSSTEPGFVRRAAESVRISEIDGWGRIVTQWARTGLPLGEIPSYAVRVGGGL